MKNYLNYVQVSSLFKGKTHLAGKISELTGLPLKCVDLSKFRDNRSVAGEDCRHSYSPNLGLVADILLDACGQDENYGNKE